MCRLNPDPCLLASLPTRCRASGAERGDRIRTRGSSTQPQQYRRTRYFGRNELSRLCLAVLRTAAGTLLSADDMQGHRQLGRPAGLPERAWTTDRRRALTVRRREAAEAHAARMRDCCPRNADVIKVETAAADQHLPPALRPRTREERDPRRASRSRSRRDR